MDTYTYRKADLSDCRSVYRLVCELEGEELSYEKFYDILNEQIQDRQHYYCLLCELAGKIIGVLNLRFERQLHHADPVAEIMEFSVDREHRGRGAGKAMFEEACRLAKRFRCIQIEAASSKVREGAHKFYLNAGMEETHIRFSKKL